MAYFFEGIQMGVLLSLLVGPLLFSLIQTSIEKGYQYGLFVGIGIWISDIMMVAIVYNSLDFIKLIVEDSRFELIVGLVGAMILVTMGIGSLLSKKVQGIDEVAFVKNSPQINCFVEVTKSLFQGFAINTFNPFTVVFWTGLSSSFIVKDVSNNEVLIYYAGIIVWLVVSDSAKVLLAEKLRPYLKANTILKLRKVTGVLFVIFGIILAGRVLNSIYGVI